MLELVGLLALVGQGEFIKSSTQTIQPAEETRSSASRVNPVGSTRVGGGAQGAGGWGGSGTSSRPCSFFSFSFLVSFSLFFFGFWLIFTQ